MAEQVADRLQVSEAQVYRFAKTALRSAAVEVGPGTLRFDPDRLARFIEARRRVAEKLVSARPARFRFRKDER
jgi:hypothetical protein